jgi:hypothetical protein
MTSQILRHDILVDCITPNAHVMCSLLPSVQYAETPKLPTGSGYQEKNQSFHRLRNLPMSSVAWEAAAT